MLKMLTAFTLEIDDVELAIEEIKEQIDFEGGLLKNSIGLINCFAEFIDTGVVEALCEALPFDVVGITTSSSGTNAGESTLGLSLTVLTADDVSFSMGYAKNAEQEQEKAILKAYETAGKSLDEQPKFVLAYIPLLFSVAGEVFLEAIAHAGDNLPVFAPLSVDHTRDYSASRVIVNGTAYKDAVAMVLVAGNVQPRFVLGGVTDQKTIKQKAIITASQANILKEVNGMPAIEYLRSLGLITTDGQIQGVATMPFLVNFNDGTKPVVRSIFGQTPEGYAVCGGRMPVGATLAIGSINHDVVLEATDEVLKTCMEAENVNGVLLFSCIGRNYALGMNVLDELQLIHNRFGKAVPFMSAYAGGEVCPVYDLDGKPQNRFHNNTIIACIL
jgi:FIST N domain./FIST C domain.